VHNILKFFIKNSLLVNFISVMLILGGVIATFSIKKETRPLVNIGGVVISTVYIGASPTDIESLITIPIEDALSGIDGIKKIQSISFTGLSRVYVEIDPDHSNEDKVASDIYRAVDSVNNLPLSAKEPEIFEIKTSNFPIVFLSLQSSSGVDDLYKAADLIDQDMISVSGVSKVDLYGKMDPVFDIILDPKLLEKYNLSFSDFFYVLTNYNHSGPAGSFVSKKEETQIRLDQELNSIDKIENLVLRVNEFGKSIRISDVARTEKTFKDNKVVSRFKDQTAVGVSIVKSNSGDTIKTVKGIKSKLNDISKSFPESVSYTILYDDSIFVEDTLRFTSQNALIGLFLVLIVLLFGLNNFKVSLATAFGLPVAFFGSIVLIFILGYSLNMMTLIGVILVIGMLVDDSIVVSENIFYNYEKGMSIEEAGVKGVMQVFWPVIGAVSTTIIAFMPLIFMKGVMGKFMSVIPVAVITALVFSLIECFLILPNHLVHILKLGKHKKPKPSKVISYIERQYSKLIEVVLKRKWLFSFISIVFVVFIIVISIIILRVELFSAKGIVQFSIILKGPNNISLEKTLEASKQIEDILNDYIPDEISYYSLTAGQAERQMGAFINVGANYAGIDVYFPPLNKRPVKEEITINKIRERVLKEKHKDFNVVFDVPRGGPPIGSAVDLMIKSNDLNSAKIVSNRIKQYLNTIKGLVDITDTIDEDKYEYLIYLDQKKAFELGISARDVQLTTMSAFEGIGITSVRINRDDTEIRVRYSNLSRDNLDNLLNIKFKTRLNTYVALKSFASISKNPALSEIYRDSRSRYVSLTADISDKKLSSKKVNTMIKDNLSSFTLGIDNIKVEFKGQEEETNELVKDLIKLVIIAVISIFMIIALIFNSMIYPFFVLLAIPFGVAGALLALIMHNISISVAVMVALVGLTGVVVNDAILLIKTIVEIKNSNKEIQFIDAVALGSRRRLRPILLTSITTLAGLIPAAYELFGVNEFMKQMSLVIAWGLFFSTIMTMLAIPALLVCTKNCYLKFCSIFAKCLKK